MKCLTNVFIYVN